MEKTVHYEKTLTSEVLFEGRVITLTKDTALLENGKTAEREVVHHHGGACILPYFEDGTICMDAAKAFFGAYTESRFHGVVRGRAARRRRHFDHWRKLQRAG